MLASNLACGLRMLRNDTGLHVAGLRSLRYEDLVGSSQMMLEKLFKFSQLPSGQEQIMRAAAVLQHDSQRNSHFVLSKASLADIDDYISMEELALSDAVLADFGVS